MKISIFGWGKMGKELLDVFLDQTRSLPGLEEIRKQSKRREDMRRKG